MSTNPMKRARLAETCRALEAGLHSRIGGRNGGVRATITGNASEVTEGTLLEAIRRECWQSSYQAG